MKNILVTLGFVIGGILLIMSPFIIDLFLINAFKSSYESLLFLLLIFLIIVYVISIFLDLIIETIIKVILKINKEDSLNILSKLVISVICSYFSLVAIDSLFSKINLNVVTIIVMVLVHNLILYFVESKLDNVENQC
ncbi:hypothetical protein BFS35_003000 [Macrococcoides goetzii]|uniref:Uncharacterized protein n=1 Tax=Macrococcoides goetzii TaxID=1891097 RepID=A0A2G5NTX6_9STAP|nr:hypothetical protein [Macrococcus goetzii]RAI82669.1 hypothetical protein BFS35_003000 [Macrococcus goetzii]